MTNQIRKPLPVTDENYPISISFRWPPQHKEIGNSSICVSIVPQGESGDFHCEDVRSKLIQMWSYRNLRPEAELRSTCVSISVLNYLPSELMEIAVASDFPDLELLEVEDKGISLNLAATMPERVYDLYIAVWRTVHFKETGEFRPQVLKVEGKKYSKWPIVRRLFSRKESGCEISGP